MNNTLPRAVNSSLSRSLAAQVCRRIGEQILSGHLAPGTFLPDENGLASEYDVSRTVVREAVKMLVAKGMLEVRPRTGTRVRDIRDWQVLDRDVLMWHHSIEVSDDRLLRLMELRQSIEPDASFRAAERRTQDDLTAIFSALGAMERHTGENEKYVLADAQFHIAVLRAAHNMYLDALENAIFVGLMLSIRVTNPDQAQNSLSVPLHQAIAEAIRAGDCDVARAAMREHLDDAARRLSRAI